MKATATEYTEVEYEIDEFVIGSIVYKDGKICHAKIYADMITNLKDMDNLEDFLKQVRYGMSA